MAANGGSGAAAMVVVSTKRHVNEEGARVDCLQTCLERTPASRTPAKSFKMEIRRTRRALNNVQEKEEKRSLLPSSTKNLKYKYLLGERAGGAQRTTGKKNFSPVKF